MKRHNAGELPLSSPAGDGGRRLAANEEAEDKMDKYDKGRVRCSRLCFLFALAATVSILARHCYDAGLGRGASAGVVRIEAVPHAHGLPPPVRRDRKIVPVARGGEPSEPRHSTSSPVDAGVVDASSSSKPSVPRPDESASANGGKTSSGAHAHTKQRGGGHPFASALAAADDKADLCGGQYIYVHELPARFNKDMVQNCDKLSPWTDMCRYTTNGGFGPLLRGGKGAFQGNGNGWYDTDEHALDIVFHERIKRYECLTDDPSLAAAVFVPFYAGLDVARHLWGNNATARDELALDLASLLAKSPAWRAMGGRDHFFVAGRTTWDFRRKVDDAHAGWGSRLLNLPAAKNMTALVVEASPWHLNDVAVPYPTSFHPASDEDLFFWQDRVRALDRTHLFSFAGVARPGDAKSIEGRLVDQCRAASGSCALMECSPTGPDNRCESYPSSVMKLFQSSTFCLMPRGGTDTRRPAFDAMLAGCIPVFFHPSSAYVQYTWHLPRTHTDYSVYIPEDDVRSKNDSVEERLRKIPPETVRAMRDAVVDLIPSITYGDATSRLETTVKDAFDIAVAEVIKKVTKLRRGIVEGQPEEQKLERYSWKYPLLAQGQKAEDHHEWDPLFN